MVEDDDESLGSTVSAAAAAVSTTWEAACRDDPCSFLARSVLASSRKWRRRARILSRGDLKEIRIPVQEMFGFRGQAKTLKRCLQSLPLWLSGAFN